MPEWCEVKAPADIISPHLPRFTRRTDSVHEQSNAEHSPGLSLYQPVVLGLLIFTIGPMLTSFYMSFTKFPLLRAPEWIGLRNYVVMFTSDKNFWQACKVTLIYAGTSVPLGLVGAFVLAMLLNQRVKGIAFFRTSFYMPAIVPAIASLILWGWLMNRDYGLINAILVRLGFSKFSFFAEPETALASMVMMSLWGVGAGMIIYLAGAAGDSRISL